MKVERENPVPTDTVYHIYRSNIIFIGKFEIQKKSGKIR